jgi:ABC-2 type transport system ATP-binding protein
MTRRPPAVEVRELHKSFRIPTERVHRLKERALHPFRGTTYTELKVLEDVSFEIERGEFFGIVGANGSGKSTLLKLLASIYRADSGRIRVAGQVIPFIELGVGFNPELTAYDNVMLNGVMMGLTPRQARRRFDEIMDFAGLHEFGELQLKNYSSGMQVRLAFSVMLQVRGDVLLIDEVLAVGDAAFQEKCTDSLMRLQKQGRTIVFVTHSMPLVERHCDRAMLLDGGRIARIGDPVAATSAYLEIGRRGDGLRVSAPERTSASELPGAFTKVVVEDDAGRERRSVSPGERMSLRAVLELRTEVERAWIRVEIRNHEGIKVFGRGSPWLDAGEGLQVGEQVHLRVSLENRLVPGEYFATFSALADDPGGLESLAIAPSRSQRFTVSGRREDYEGLLALDHELEVQRESRRAALR